MDKQNSKSFDWSFTTALIIASFALIYFAFIYNLPHQYEYSTPAEQVNSSQKIAYASLSSYNKDSDYPYVKTEFTNIYYVAKPNKDIEFYKYDKGNFNQIKQTKTIKLTIKISGQNLPIKVNYIEQNGKKLGFGTYVTKDKSKYYKYAFFKLCDMPKDYNSDADLLLLMDFDSKDIYKSNKEYSEVFELNSKTLKAKRAISAKGRHISVVNGKVREDFCVINDNALSSFDDRLIFLSSRNYKQSSGVYGTDIYYQTEFTDTPTLVTENALDGFMYQSDDGVLYLKYTSKDGNQNFSLILNNGKEKVLKTFQGVISEGYLRCGNYLIDKGTMTVYNLVDNSESVLLGVSMNNLYTFAVSPNNTKVVLAGSFENGNQKLVFYDLTIKRYKSVEYRELFFEDYPNLCFVDNDTVSYIKPADAVDMVVGNVVISWNKIFSTLS